MLDFFESEWTDGVYVNIIITTGMTEGRPSGSIASERKGLSYIHGQAAAKNKQCNNCGGFNVYGTSTSVLKTN